ncbi:PTS lactose/cellobiose transporter subunit IIA [Candidatus Stoquefichus massiliensis]|uniref:PTS lactose/cellobiose transporter subunit IIA n=1 Tax=Candidatus Stoquefichus massiliensis TaxID=1470350 RepID=UPI0004878DEC|nr:PTS lactose/cellobiose transporter subunit IIA [Candidatus Stoquefichus massiliensis]
MEDSRYLNDFQIVALAGDSRAKSMMALKKARQEQFQEAQELLKIAEEEMNNAHNLQFDMLQKESRGEPVDITIVTIHGQDHLTMATVTHDLVVEMIEILKNK